MDMGGIAVIDYLFHVRLMAAGVLLVVAMARRPGTAGLGSAAPARTTRA